MRPGYREDIDWLRAIAVLSVVAFQFEKPLLHTWSLAVEEQFYLALPVLVWTVLRAAPKSRIALPLLLTALTSASFALSIMLMRSDQSANAFFMSPPRAWEFLVGALVA